jgi:hypothetical protein
MRGIGNAESEFISDAYSTLTTRSAARYDFDLQHGDGDRGDCPKAMESLAYEDVARYDDKPGTRSITALPSSIEKLDTMPLWYGSKRDLHRWAPSIQSTRNVMAREFLHDNHAIRIWDKCDEIVSANALSNFFNAYIPLNFKKREPGLVLAACKMDRPDCFREIFIAGHDTVAVTYYKEILVDSGIFKPDELAGLAVAAKKSDDHLFRKLIGQVATLGVANTVLSWWRKSLASKPGKWIEGTFDAGSDVAIDAIENIFRGKSWLKGSRRKPFIIDPTCKEFNAFLRKAKEYPGKIKDASTISLVKRRLQSKERLGKC